MPAIVQSTSTEGLKATTFTVPTAGSYSLSVTATTQASQTPAVSQGPGGGAGTGVGGGPILKSQLVIVVSKTTTGTILTTAAGDRGCTIRAINCAANDVITITPSSSSTREQQSNSIRLTCTLSGPN